MKILTVCPSIRTQMRDEMLDSYLSTKELPGDIVLDNRTNITITQLINEVYAKNSDYDFYHITNDDVIYRTKGWDAKFVEESKLKGPGVFYGKDLFMDQRLPTFPFISKALVQAVGYLQEPSMIRYYGDTVWASIAKPNNCLFFVPQVVIEHRTHFNGKAEGQVDEQAYLKDSESFYKWAAIQAIIDIAKVRGVLNAR